MTGTLPSNTGQHFCCLDSTEREVRSNGENHHERAELSSQMGISLPKAYELVRTPGFPSIRIGTRILIPIDAFREWLVITSNQQK